MTNQTLQYYITTVSSKAVEYAVFVSHRG